VITLVGQVMKSKSQAQDVADRAAFVLTLVAIVIGAITFVAWILFKGVFSFALERMVTVMVVTCPHALGLAIPLVIAVITGYAAKRGLLIRNRRAFEMMRNVTLVVFDKTGTLTSGIFTVTDVVPLGENDSKHVLQLAASIEAHAQHSIAQAIIKKAEQEKIMILPVSGAITIPGKGAQGMINGKKITIGNEKILDILDISEQRKEHAYVINKELAAQGKTAVYVAEDDAVVGVIAASDTIRDESFQACKDLADRGISVAMITGDNPLSAHAVAKKLGIKIVLAQVLPHQKAEKIQELQQKGAIVAMVGDGINDAPALVAATVGIAIGAGTDVAIEAADIILVQNDPRRVMDAVLLAKKMYVKMIQNLFWAISYNILALPVAAGLLYHWGIMLNPALGAVLMSLSTIIVAINSRLIRV
jgi:Cu2+-exporting ATPase